MDNKTYNSRRTAEQWQTIVDQQSQSGLSGAAFCKAEGLKYQSFMNWRKRLEKSLPEIEPAPEAQFVELTCSDKSASSEPIWSIELDLAPGIQLRIAR